MAVGYFRSNDNLVVGVNLYFSFQACIDIVVLCVFCLLVVVGEIISICHITFFVAFGECVIVSMIER